jgi:hypothetical protein
LRNRIFQENSAHEKQGIRCKRPGGSKPHPVAVCFACRLIRLPPAGKPP